MLTRMRLGHCGLAACLVKIGKHVDGLCEYGESETISHVLLSCSKYANERRRLYIELADLGLATFSFKTIFSMHNKQVEDAVMLYLRSTSLILRI